MTNEARDKAMQEGMASQMEQLVAAREQRAEQGSDGGRWFHAWIGSRLIRKAATPSGIDGADTLHESIIAYQGGRRLATTQDTHTGYRRYGRVTAHNEIYPGDTSCDFKTLSDEPILISYCCANTHNGTQEMTEELNISLLQAYSREATGNAVIDWRRVGDIAAAVVNAAGVVATGRFLLVWPAVSAIRTLIGAIVGNRNGPLAYGVIFIENPQEMKAVDSQPDASHFKFLTYRCQNFSHGSDYEIECKVKPMNKEDRNAIGIAMERDGRK